MRMGRNSECRTITWMSLLMTGLMIGSLTSVGLAADEVPSRPLSVSVLDVTGVPMRSGKVVFCPEHGDCQEHQLSYEGIIILDLDEFMPGTTYTVVVYDTGQSIRYINPGYVMTEKDLIGGADRKGAQIVGARGQGLIVDLTGLGSADRLAHQGPNPLNDPHFLTAITVPFMIGGNFDADESALGGITEVSPGLGITAMYRFGYPQPRPLKKSTVGFQELSIGYAMNRYTTAQIDESDPESDLSFHRAWLAYGLGRLGHRWQASASLAVSFGGIFDGSTVLDYEDRHYTMVGFGLQGRGIWQFLGGRGLAMGLVGQFELMYYPVDTVENDHWYGLAPSVALGLAIF